MPRPPPRSLARRLSIKSRSLRDQSKTLLLSRSGSAWLCCCQLAQLCSSTRARTACRDQNKLPARPLVVLPLRTHRGTARTHARRRRARDTAPSDDPATVHARPTLRLRARTLARSRRSVLCASSCSSSPTGTVETSRTRVSLENEGRRGWLGPGGTDAMSGGATLPPRLARGDDARASAGLRPQPDDLLLVLVAPHPGTVPTRRALERSRGSAAAPCEPGCAIASGGSASPRVLHGRAGSSAALAKGRLGSRTSDARARPSSSFSSAVPTRCAPSWSLSAPSEPLALGVQPGCEFEKVGDTAFWSGSRFDMDLSEHCRATRTRDRLSRRRSRGYCSKRQLEARLAFALSSARKAVLPASRSSIKPSRSQA